MPEYIEREAALKILRGEAVARYPASFYYGLFAAADEVRKIPAADVVSKAAFNQVKWERDTAMEQLKEHGIPFGGKANVVAVVRCKDCKHNLGCEGNFIQCGYWLDIVKSNGFCSYGERRADNATD